MAIGMPPRRIHEIIRCKRRIAPDMALRIGRYFGVDEQFWINLQSHYDPKVEMAAAHPGDALESIQLLQTS